MNRTVLGVAAILFVLTGCMQATESSPNATRNPAVPAGNGERPNFVQESANSEVTAEKIVSDIVGRVVQVSELTGAGPETEWTFDADEFRKVNILEKRMTEKGLTLVIFMTTRNNPKQDEDSVLVSGKLQLEYEKRADQWILKTVENLSFYYSVGQSI